MNKRRREILAALTPAVEFAMSQAGLTEMREPPAKRDVPGLALRARADASAPAELMIYGAIGGGGWMEDGISAIDVAHLLKEAGPGPINVRINSGGGDAFQGVAIYTQLVRHNGLVHTFNDGLAASAASVIFMAGARRTTSKYAMTMIHDGMTGPYGNAKTLRRSADLLDQVSQTIAELYADAAGEDAEYWRNLMTVNEEDGTWFGGVAAQTAGLADEVSGEPDGEDEESLVWDRLAGWTERVKLPEEISAKVQARLAAKDDELIVPPRSITDEEIADLPILDPALLGDGITVIDDDDFAHTMRMWAFLNNNGR